MAAGGLASGQRLLPLLFLTRVRRGGDQVPALESRKWLGHSLQPRLTLWACFSGQSARKGPGSDSPSPRRETCDLWASSKGSGLHMGPGEMRTNTGKAAELAAGRQPWKLPLTWLCSPILGIETPCLPLFPTVPCDKRRNLWMAVLLGGTCRETGTQPH